LRVASTHVTCFASMYNAKNFVGKLITYKLVDMFGIFSPNLLGCLATLVFCYYFYPLLQDPKFQERIRLSDEKVKVI